MRPVNVIGLAVGIMLVASGLAIAYSPYLILFDLGQFEISSAGRAVIDQVLSDARYDPDGRIVLTGHADRVGSDRENAHLALLRAQAVRDALVAGGIAADRITVQGKGELEPAIATADGVSEQANRRVEVVFLEALREVEPSADRSSE